MDLSDFWGEPIHTYTRAEALADGVLVDVTETAREAGFSIPVAITAAVSADLADQGDRDGRLWDLLWLGVVSIRKAKAVALQDRRLHGRSSAEADGSELVYALIMPVGASTNYRAKLHIGPGDAGEPVLTIMQAEED